MVIMSQRVAITQATLDHWRDRPFAWGKADCVKMAAHHLHAMGHRVRFTKAGSYSTALGAKRALRRAGYPSLSAALDGHFLPRIPYAMALEGDIVAGAGDGPFEALGIVLGNGALLGFHVDTGCAGPLRALEVGTCWQVIPR